MVNNLQDFRLIHAVHRLCFLIMIHKYHLFAPHIQKVSSRNHPTIVAFLVKNWKISVALLRHHIFDFFYKSVFLECIKVIPHHKMLDRHALVNQARHRICIVRRADHCAAMFLCKHLDRVGYLRPLTHNYAPRLHLDCTELGFIAVAQNNKVVLLNIIFHQIRVCRRNKYFSPVKYRAGIPHQHCTVKCFQNIGIRCPCFGQYPAVIDLHIRSCDIADGNQTCQLPSLRDWQCYHILLLHQHPGFF